MKYDVEHFLATGELQSVPDTQKRQIIIEIECDSADFGEFYSAVAFFARQKNSRLFRGRASAMKISTNPPIPRGRRGRI